jgi:hypothetical protein
MSDHTARRRFGFRLLSAAVLAALAYPLSLGPACWALSWLHWDMERPGVAYAVSGAYSPLAPAVVYGPGPVRRALRWWIGVGCRPGPSITATGPAGSAGATRATPTPSGTINPGLPSKPAGWSCRRNRVARHGGAGSSGG